MIKVRKLYDPYKQTTFANVEDLIALLKDARQAPCNYNSEAVERLCKESLGQENPKQAAENNPF